MDAPEQSIPPGGRRFYFGDARAVRAEAARLRAQAAALDRIAAGLDALDELQREETAA